MSILDLMPIPVFMAIVIYFTIWWIVLFAVLPWGVTSQSESGDVVRGSEPGAPVAPKLLVKVLWTTGISFVVFAIVMGMFVYWA